MPLISLLLLGCGNTEAPDPKALMQASCGAGKPDACFKLGTDHLNAPAPRYAEARKNFNTGCGVHHAPSCNALGTLVRDARGGPKDMVRAFGLFQTSCETDKPELRSRQGCINYADVLRSGEGAEKNLELAGEKYRAECEHESPLPKACTNLSEMLRAGEGAEKDIEAADALLAKACEGSFAPACQALAKVKSESRKKEEVAEAAALFERACGIDANYGCFEMAQLHVDKKIDDASFEQAGEYYSMICRVDTSRGCYELAELMTEKKVASREGEKEALYKLSCESGFSEACDKR